MATTYTTNYNLGKQENHADKFDMDVITDNADKIDAALTAKADKSTTYTKTEVDTALSSKQNTISDLSTIRSGAALGATAVQPVSGKGLSTNDYTTAEKEKLAGIEAQANKTTVDSALSESSTNPVQNKVVKSALDGKQAALSTEQLAAVNSGVTSTDVAQIETNKNNISLLTQYGGGRNVLSASQVTTSSSVINIETIPAGTYKFHCDTDEPAHWALKFRNASNTDIYVVESAGAMGPNAAITVTLTEDAVKISPWWQSLGTGLKNMYLCRESDWTTPYVYQPYAMSNAEITAWILAHS